MKKWIIYTSLIVLFAVLTRCQDKLFEKYTANSPVYLSYEDLRSAVKKETSREIENPGKIYFKDNYIFINEIMDGVHLIDVSDPSHPGKVGFVEIPGNLDIAVRENILYADSYVDLVAIDVSDLNNINEVGRIEDIFPYTVPEYDTKHPLARVDKEKGVVVNWEIKKIKEQIEQREYPVYYYSNAKAFGFDGAYLATSSPGVGGGGGTTFGVGGSMARFGLYKDFLYTVDESKLYSFKITDLENPVSTGSKNIGGNVETMFIFNGHIFFGTTTGMLVYSLENEQNPKYITIYEHVSSCDPVVVQDNLAYVTLRDGRSCGSAVNRLDVIELSSDYSSNDLLMSYPMSNPHGLGIDGDILFICDGDDGLKVFDVSDPLKILSHKLAGFPEINAKDVIPVNNYLFIIGDGGFFLYDYNNIQNIMLLSSIPVSEAGN